MAIEEEMEDEEAEAWAAMREAFDDDDDAEDDEATAQLKQQNTALAFASVLLKKTASKFDEDLQKVEAVEKEVAEGMPAEGASAAAAPEGQANGEESAAKDVSALEAEEDAAWAELRAAFGDESLFGGAEEEFEEEEEDLPAPRTPRQKAPAPKAKPTADELEWSAPGSKAWLQEQVDQLIGESQRLAGTSFTAVLLGKLWSLPLEDQHDVLLGSTGALTGFTGTKGELASKLWSLMGDEIDARNGFVPLSAVKKEEGGVAKRERSRSRSRSLSL